MCVGCMYVLVWVYICIYVIVYVYIWVHVWVCMLECVHVYVDCMCCVCCICVHVSISVQLRVAAFRTRSCYPNLITGDGFLLAEDTIHWRFEDRPMGWSGDSYRFVQWRPDDDSVLKLRHFRWVFVYWSFSISALYLIVSWEYIYYSVLYCSWPCLFRWYLYQSSSVWDWDVFDILSTGYLELVVSSWYLRPTNRFYWDKVWLEILKIDQIS